MSFAINAASLTGEHVSGDVIENSLGMKFAKVPGASVLFSIWLTRVSDFTAFAAETGYDATKDVYSFSPKGWAPKGTLGRARDLCETDDSPVCAMSWYDAKAFCDWLTKKERLAGRISSAQVYRLPTEAEWKIAVGLVDGSRALSIKTQKSTRGAISGHLRPVPATMPAQKPRTTAGRYVAKWHPDAARSNAVAVKQPGVEREEQFGGRRQHDADVHEPLHGDRQPQLALRHDDLADEAIQHPAKLGQHWCRSRAAW